MSLAAALVLFLFGSQAVERETFEVYLCARHPDEQKTAPGRCLVCGENLVLRILVPSFSCPMHPGYAHLGGQPALNAYARAFGD